MWRVPSVPANTSECAQMCESMPSAIESFDRTLADMKFDASTACKYTLERSRGSTTTLILAILIAFREKKNGLDQ